MEAVPTGIGPGQTIATDAVVRDAAEKKAALMFAHRRDHGVMGALEVPECVEDLALVVEFHHAAGVEIGIEPFVLRDSPRHAAPEAGQLESEIDRGRPHANDRQPIMTIGGAIDIVRITRQRSDDGFQAAALRSIEPVPFDAAAPSLGEEDGLAVVAGADPVGKLETANDRAGRIVARVVADDAAVAAALQ